jgi:lipoprotein-anchoring transpeptidase ErfK/SrfK
VRLIALTVLVIGNLFANQVQAEDISTEPLTRVDCDKAGMAAWDDTANVCGSSSQAAEAMLEDPGAQHFPTSEVAESLIQPLTRQDCDKADLPWNDSANVCGTASQMAEAIPEIQDAQSEVADTLGQPLTRQDCDKADLTWNDSANVCGAASQAAEVMPEAQEPATQTVSDETSPIASTVLINIDKASQKMTVLLDGVQQYVWAVSTGLRGYTTPSGTYSARSMNKIWYSRQWDNAPMPHAVFFTRDGHAIHGTYEVKRLGKPSSHGCVRLSPENAALLYALVEKTGLKNTQVVLAGSTPGGEGKVANSTRGKSSYRSRSRYKNYYADSFPQRPKRGGIFRRLFGG